MALAYHTPLKLNLIRVSLSLQMHNVICLSSPLILIPSLILQHAHYNNRLTFSFKLYRYKLYFLLGSLFHEHILLYFSTFSLDTCSLLILNSILVLEVSSSRIHTKISICITQDSIYGHYVINIENTRLSLSLTLFSKSFFSILNIVISLNGLSYNISSIMNYLHNIHLD